MRLQDIAGHLEMTQSTVLRYLNSLLQSNYAYQDEDTLRYGLTLKLCKLSYNLSSNMGIKSIAAPFLNDLTGRLGVSSCLVIEYEENIVYLDVVNSPLQMKRTLNRIGKDAPMHCTGSGKIFLSSKSDYALKAFIDKGLAPLTEYTITDGEKLRHEIEIIRKQGFSMDEQECELGIRCVSVPLYDYKETICAALSVFAPIDVLSDECIVQRILPELNKAARVISLRLGSDTGPKYDDRYFRGEKDV